MTNPIVTVNVQQLTPPTPSTLQSTGAFISCGGTTLAAGTYSLLTGEASLTPLLQGGLTLASLTQSAGVATATLESTTISSGTYNATTGLVTLTLAASLGLSPGNLVEVSAATGTGSYASIDGTFVCGAGTSGTTVTYTVAAALTMTITGGNAEATFGLANGTQFLTTIAGAGVTAYNGTFLATIASATTFTFAIPSATASPATGAPTATPPSVAELVAMATEFYAQGAQQAVYVLELGAGTQAQAVTALTNFIANNPGQGSAPSFFYAYLVPRNWDSIASFLTLLGSYETTTSKTYFFITSTIANYGNYTATMKCAKVWVEAPTVPVSAPLEFDAAADFFNCLSVNPSSTNKVTPNAFDFLDGVTPYPQPGNGPTLVALKAASINYVGTGAEGGLSDNLVLFGTTKDGNDFLSYWFSVDWVQINLDLNVTNAVINGSNSKVNPLYYNQQGINRLQRVAASTMSTGIANGSVFGTILQTQLDPATLVQNYDNGLYAGYAVINAQPFISYNQANPNDYALGKYNGLTAIYTPQLGFKAIVFNVLVSNFVAA